MIVNLKRGILRVLKRRSIKRKKKQIRGVIDKEINFHHRNINIQNKGDLLMLVDKSDVQEIRKDMKTGKSSQTYQREVKISEVTIQNSDTKELRNLYQDRDHEKNIILTPIFEGLRESETAFNLHHSKVKSNIQISR